MNKDIWNRDRKETLSVAADVLESGGLYRLATKLRDMTVEHPDDLILDGHDATALGGGINLPINVYDAAHNKERVLLVDRPIQRLDVRDLAYFTQEFDEKLENLDRRSLYGGLFGGQVLLDGPRMKSILIINDCRVEFNEEDGEITGGVVLTRIPSGLYRWAEAKKRVKIDAISFGDAGSGGCTVEGG